MLQPLDFSKHSVTDVKVGSKEMFLDGIVVKVKDIVRSWKRTLLVAYRIRPDAPGS